MLRRLLRLILIVVTVVAIGAFFLGYRWGGARPVVVEDRPVGTTGPVRDIDTSKAREAGAAIGETVAVGANAAERAISAASLTAGHAVFTGPCPILNDGADYDGTIHAVTFKTGKGQYVCRGVGVGPAGTRSWQVFNGR